MIPVWPHILMFCNKKIINAKRCHAMLYRYFQLNFLVCMHY